MTGSQLYPAKQRPRIWLALLTSVLLHGAAVALAEIHRDPTSIAPEQSDHETIVEIETAIASPEATPPPDPPDTTPPPAISELIEFPDDAPTPPPRTLHRNTTPLVRVSHLRSGPAAPSARALAISAPRPEYPYEARRSHITGDGVALLTIDETSGRVLEVTMSKSTGSTVLDQAAISGFRRWRFQAGSASVVRCPITYTLSGAQF